MVAFFPTHILYELWWHFSSTVYSRARHQVAVALFCLLGVNPNFNMHNKLNWPNGYAFSRSHADCLLEYSIKIMTFPLYAK